jgi:hypothetical protein
MNQSLKSTKLPGLGALLVVFPVLFAGPTLCTYVSSRSSPWGRMCVRVQRGVTGSRGRFEILLTGAWVFFPVLWLRQKVLIFVR